MNAPVRATPAAPETDVAASALIGAVVINPADAWPHFDRVPVAAFPPGELRRAAEALHTAHDVLGGPDGIDPTTVQSAVPDCPMATFARCLEDGVTSANAPHYSGLLRRAYEARERRARLTDLSRGDLPDEQMAAALEEMAQGLQRGSMADPWQPVDVAAWFASEAPAREWLFENFLTRGIVAQLAAAGGSGKTFLSIGLALSLASGRVLYPSLRPAAARRVLAVWGEDDAAEVHRRARLAAEAMHLDELDERRIATNLRAVCGHAMPLMSMRDGNLTPTVAYRALRTAVRDHGADLVILDPQSRLYGGEENSNDAAAQFIACLNEIAVETGATLLLLHHVAKGDGHTRGASAFRDGCRWASELRPLSEDEAKAASIDADDAWRYLRLNVTKSNYSAIGGAPVCFEKGTGGVLTETQVTTAGLEPIARYAADYMEKHGLRLTRREVEKQPDGKGLREHVAKKYHHCNRDLLLAVLDAGVERGILTTEIDERHRTRVEVYCVMPDFEDAF